MFYVTNADLVAKPGVSPGLILGMASGRNLGQTAAVLSRLSRTIPCPASQDLLDRFRGERALDTFQHL
jgi:hypothetical protein